MKVSICMCTYNGEKYIKQQLDSLIQQTKLPNEIIVFDDCSNDNTVNIIKDYKKKYSQIDWIINENKKNNGWKINFHEAINKTTGDYIFLCDQDDIWMSDKIERMIEIMQKNEEIELLTCNPIVKYEKNGKEKYGFNNNGKIEKVTKNNFLTHTAFPGCTFCFKKSMIKEFNDVWQSNFPHDAILWKIAYLKETLYQYNYYGIIWRRHESNATNKMKKTFSSENVKIHFDVVLLYKEYFKKLEKISKITHNNVKKLEDIRVMLNLREKLYKEKKIYYFLKLARYRKYYASGKAYLLDLLAVTKFNKGVGKV